MYQGYENYQTWNVILWIGNDEGLYLHCQGLAIKVELSIAGGDCDQVEDGIYTAERAIRFLLADRIETLVKAHPLVNDATMYSDILNNALGRVDWHEVADSVLEQ